MEAGLEVLLRHPGIWRGEAVAEVGVPSVGTGFPSLDALLPGGGWPADALTEVLVGQPGIGELQLLLPALAVLARERWLAWVNPPHVPFAPALLAAGVDPSRLWIVAPDRPADALWSAEQSLRSGACGAVLVWGSDLADAELRRLQMAAGAGICSGFLLRDAKYQRSASPAALRLALTPADEGLGVDILKRRGGGPARLILRPGNGGNPDGPPQVDHALAGVSFPAVSARNRLARVA